MPPMTTRGGPSRHPSRSRARRASPHRADRETRRHELHDPVHIAGGPRRAAPSVAARWDAAHAIDLAVLVGLTAAGLAHPSPGTWFRDFALGFAVIAGSLLVGAGLTTLVVARTGARIQGPRVRPAVILRGVRDTARAAWIA